MLANVSRACSGLPPTCRVGQLDHRAQRPPRRELQVRGDRSRGRARRRGGRAPHACARARCERSASSAATRLRERTRRPAHQTPAHSGRMKSGAGVEQRIGEQQHDHAREDQREPAERRSRAAPRGEAEEDQQRGRDRDAAARLVERRDAADDRARGERDRGDERRAAAPDHRQRDGRRSTTLSTIVPSAVGSSVIDDAERGQRRRRSPSRATDAARAPCGDRNPRSGAAGIILAERSRHASAG